MKILLFGGSGQLGFEIRGRAQALSFETSAPVRKEVSITDKEQVRFLVEKIAPDVIINCAAYTAVDKAEEERDQAFALNRDGPAFVAQAASDFNSRLIHISTDYVFGGDFSSPIGEGAETSPLNVYGESKLAGEQEVLKYLGDRALIVRTSSLHGQNGNNFVHIMLKLFEEREELRVVSDQVMCPTWAGWLAEVVLDLCRIDTHGIIHAVSRGQTTWFDFAQTIREYATPPEGGWKVRIEPIPAAEYPSAARRPQYSVLDCRNLLLLLGRESISWEEGLRNHLSDIERLRND